MATPCNCDDCVADPSLTCSYTGEDRSVLAVYLANGFKGSLFLSPGGDNGQIGGLLHQLTPPQHYSHMGIMVKDLDLVRHTTASPRRLTSDEYYSGNILGVAVPADGLNRDHVQFAWPGSITQSIEQALFADQYGDKLSPPGQDGPYHGADLVDPESPSQKSYRIAALSFSPVFDNGQWFYPLIVRPCPALMINRPDVDAALQRVADQAISMYAYYSFYCYSQGNAGGVADLSTTAQCPVAQPDWDPARLTWKDWSDPAQVKWINARVIPAVCSSFIWQAVQEVNKTNKIPIILDWADNHNDALGNATSCGRSLPPDWSADQPTVDGLYAYDQATRERAGQWLHDSLADEVFDSLKSALADKGGPMQAIAAAIEDAGRVAFIAAASAGADAVITLLEQVLTASGLLGVEVPAVLLDAAFADQLIELLYDMPDDIANQICNSFAFDCHRGFPSDAHCVDAAGNPIPDIDSDNWRTAPGTGSAVSPDNIAMFWDAPAPSVTNMSMRGLYGWNERIQLVSAVVSKPVCALVPSAGTARVHGTVTYKGALIQGAHVGVNSCDFTWSSTNGYSLTVRAGVPGGEKVVYKVVARYAGGPTVLYGEVTVGPLLPGDSQLANIVLLDPPACLRNVEITGRVRVDDVYLTGADHAEVPFASTLHVQWGVPKFDQSSGTWVVDPNDPAAAIKHVDRASSGASTGDADGELTIVAQANPDLSVDVTVTGTLGDLTETHSIHVKKDETGAKIPEFDLDTGGPFPDRAYFRDITINNNPATAI